MNIGTDTPVRVMTWNIHGALGRNPRFDLARVVELIRRWHPDIVALQEVDSRRGLAGAVNPFEYLPGAIGIYGVGAKSLITRDGEYGQMLISRWPIIGHEVHDISFPEREPRRAIRAEITAPSGRLTVVATHLGLSFRERRSQASSLTKLVRSDGPTIMAGDFNDWFWPGSVRAVLSRVLGSYTRYKTFPAACPLFGLDRIYCGPSQKILQSFVDVEARVLSDHLPVVADVTAAVASSWPIHEIFGAFSVEECQGILNRANPIPAKPSLAIASHWLPYQCETFSPSNSWNYLEPVVPIDGFCEH